MAETIRERTKRELGPALNKMFVDIRDKHVGAALFGKGTMLEDIRAYARLQLAVQEGMTREQYINAVRSYAVTIHGETDEVRMMADRTARHLWASKR